ncbi:ClbS/DfsB family four-helix bundle protein [Schaalia sp. 19OD2882]|uniref:ClbS/DfsB family four-helix bundle protein n=1 Tax=Schaalia sp. 19OD2882 TaxID=2794089 RepID=UPI001C1EBC37|nr:ClbS/DfsB family four-helix bundle protein [Schaalia sp. 19OD2882]QWW19772.1 ClbS/DfsB family four-helix bundle protein [Schaalia sp. 19OD2882]
MARPTNKADLLKAAASRFTELDELLDSMDSDELRSTFTFEIAGKREAHWKRDKNVRDVIVHLHEWHALLVTWIEANLSGDGRPFLPAPYTWAAYGDMNVALWKEHQGTPLDEARTLLDESHARVLRLVEGFGDDELFVKRHFTWTGSTNLGSYCISATSSHYEWALKKLRLHHKTWRASYSQDQDERGAGHLLPARK